MYHFKEVLDEEIRDQRALLRKSEKLLANAPEGYLKSRQRKNGAAFYQGGGNLGRNHVKNITGDPALVDRLLQKKLCQEIQRRASKNLQELDRVRQLYEPDHYLDVLPMLSDGYEDAAAFLRDKKTPESIAQQKIDPKKHIHETVCGLLVRSKSEVIIANALAGYGIPFFYERPFPYPDERGVYFEPDFTFDLPNGETKIWEHFGMLNDMNYCIHNARKLNTYQKHDFLIGRSLIITQDDQKGNCSSSFIDKIIQEHLLPYYR